MSERDSHTPTDPGDNGPQKLDDNPADLSLPPPEDLGEAEVPTESGDPTSIPPGAMSMATFHRGPLASPQVLAEYDRLVPGEAQRQCDDLHAEKIHRKKMDLGTLALDERSDKRDHVREMTGLICAIAVSFALIGL